MSENEPLATVFESDGFAAEVEAQAIHSLLESNGIESVIVRENVPELPVGTVEVRVLAENVAQARHIIDDARAAGPEAADTAEAESEI